MHDLPVVGVLFIALPACCGTRDFMSGMKASLWGALLMALPSISGAWALINLRPS
jgi:hypothetical protein